ncbi:MAG TPA: VOC family protein [Candidatus Sulfomarinibacteraceae bacterium]|nr:VOC family protein [Candidatus Sulfomarinibacteraceae bacterium]
MRARIDLITILTDDVPRLTAFYRDVLGFPVKTDMDTYVEFVAGGVRFSICERSVMAQATGRDTFESEASGHTFELAFPCDSPSDVDAAYRRIVEAGAAPVKGPADMPWGQRTAFFADPDGNVHELFADLNHAPV